MPIRVEVIAEPVGSRAEKKLVVLPDHGGTIGRDARCDLVLHDESRYVSSQHAVLRLDDGVIQLTDSSSNGCFINLEAEPVGKGRSRTLADGDELMVGDFVLRIARYEDADATAVTPGPGRESSGESLDALLARLGPTSPPLVGEKLSGPVAPDGEPVEPAPARPLARDDRRDEDESETKQTPSEIREALARGLEVPSTALAALDDFALLTAVAANLRQALAALEWQLEVDTPEPLSARNLKELDSLPIQEDALIASIRKLDPRAVRRWLRQWAWDPEEIR